MNRCQDIYRMLGALSGTRRAVTCAASIMALSALAACENESNPTDPGTSGGEAAINTIVTSPALNATSADTLIAYNLTTNSVVPNKTTGDWDIAFRRYEVRLNSPATAGAITKNVTAYSVGNSKALTDAQVITFTAANTLAAFDTLRANSIPADNLFTTDRLIENKYGYLNLNGQPTAAPLNYWKVKTANGGYALLHVNAITFSAQQNLASVTVESRVQTGTALGAARSVTLPLGTTPTFFSAVTNTAVTANGCNWDLSINPVTFDVTTNSACGVGTYPGTSSTLFADVTTASDGAQYPLFLSTLGGPIPNSFTDLNAPFRYDLIPDSHRLFPAFNIYLVKVGAKVFKVQIINYYNATGDGAYPTLRSARIL